MISKIAIKDAKPGMRTARVEDSAWMQEPGLYAGTAQTLTEETLARLRDEGYRNLFVQTGEVRELLGQARKTYLDALKVASRVVMDVTQGKPVDIKASRQSVKSLLAQVYEDADGLACVVRLTPVEAYLCSHMVNVAATVLCFGHDLGLRENELVPLGLAAFLHDIGMTRLPLDVLCGKNLSPLDERELRKHPLFSAGLLRSAGGLSRNIRRAVVEHHEKHDGSGYPEGLAGSKIGAWGRILHLADVYDALTRESCRGGAKPPHQALSLMYAMGGSGFEPSDVERFVKCMGVYPPGSMVTLHSGEGAVVLRNSGRSSTAPLVSVVLDAEGRLQEPYVLDLAGEGEAQDGVAGSLDPGTMLSAISGRIFSA